MKRAVFLAACVALLAASTVAADVPKRVETASDADRHGHAYVPVRPESLGGQLTLQTLDGAPFTLDNLRGSWSLVYFGYSRCRSACPIGLVNVAEAVTQLRRSGFAPKAVFVDVEAPPATAPRIRRAMTQQEIAAQGPHDLHTDPRMRAIHESAIAAARETAARYRDRVTVLTGSRGQLRNAVEAFRVRREHVPARDGEQGHSINHTTMVYVLDPTGKVKGYLYHDAAAEDMVRLVRQLARAGT